MGSITAGELVDEASRILYDRVQVAYPIPELLQYLTAAQRQIVALKPEAGIVIHTLASQSGSRQTLPNDAVALSRVIRNSSGRTIVLIDQREIDEQNVDWHSATPAADAEHYVYSAETPRDFWVTPPSDGTGSYEIAYVKTPSTIQAVDDVIEIPDIYSNALVRYAVYLAYMRGGKTQNLNAASIMQSAFLVDLGLREQAERKVEPGMRKRDNPYSQ